MRIQPYLTFNGNCREAFEFYAQCLGGKIVYMMTNAQSPLAEQCAADQQDAILHATMTLGGQVIMGADSPPEEYARPRGMHLTISTRTADEADRIFECLARGGVVRLPIRETFWTVRYGMVTDRFGTPWVVNCEKPACR